MDRGDILFLIMIIIGIIVVASLIISSNQRNEFCQKIGYEEHTFINNQTHCRRTVNDMIEAIPIYCELGRCWKITEGT